MDQTTKYLRRAIIQWELLRIAHLLVICGVFGVLAWRNPPQRSDDYLLAAMFVVLTNIAYCLGPTLDIGLCLLANVRIGAHRYAIWWAITLLPLFKLDYLLRLLQFYAHGLFTLIPRQT